MYSIVLLHTKENTFPLLRAGLAIYEETIAKLHVGVINAMWMVNAAM